jgi:acetyl esterase/lipase
MVKYQERTMCLLVFAILCLLASSRLAAEERQVPSDVVVEYNIAYREGHSNSWKLDLAMPKQLGGTPRPAIVVIHGGGWIEGSRSSYSYLKDLPPGNVIDFAKLGFVAAAVDYRLSKEAPFPAALEDCKCAVRWLRANSEKYHVDPDRIAAIGGSAGAHLALMLAMVDKSAGLEGDGPYQEQSSMVQAAVSDSGPIDLLHQHQHMQIPVAIESFLAGPPDAGRIAEYKRASPSNYVSPRCPPLLLIYGEVDTQVGVETADQFVEALGRAGAKDVTYCRLGQVDHCPYTTVRVPWVVQSTNEFLIRILKPGDPTP